MSNIDLSNYKNLYLETCEEYQKKIEENMSKLVNNYEDILAVEEIHRAIHSLKSSSFFMGFTKTASICSQLENICYEIKMGTIKISENLLILFSDSLKNLYSSLEKIKNENNEIDLSESLQKLEEATGVKSSIKESVG